MTTPPPASVFVGKALYLEFRKGVNTAQIVITPEGVLPDGTYVPSGTWRRQISSWNPKKPWKTYISSKDEYVNTRKTELATNKELTMGTIDEAKSVGIEVSDALTYTLNDLNNNEWKLFMKPIVLDFSMEDLQNTKDWETPSALIRRILRARKELEFPDELIENSEVAE